VRARPRRLALVGSVLVDILMYVDALPTRGGDTVARESLLTAGGGFNALAGAARLGLPAAYAGRVGDGPMGARVASDLSAAGIPALLPRAVGEDSGFDIGLVEPDAERTFVTSPGVESRLRPSDLAALPLQPGDAVYVSGYDLCYPVSGATLEAWLLALGAEYLVVLDPGPLAAEIPADRLRRALARADILSLNARETTLLTGDEDASRGASALAARIAPGGWVVARVGARGCWVARRGEPAEHIPARPARAVDTTGAGDMHVAALLAALAMGRDLPAAAWAANVAAALSVERKGPATGPDRAEWEEAIASAHRGGDAQGLGLR